jgi:hypothetical protein
MKNTSLNPKISISFPAPLTSTTDCRPLFIVDGKYIGKIDRLEFSRTGRGIRPIDLGIRKIHVTKDTRMPGVPPVEDDIPAHLFEIVEFSGRGSFGVISHEKEEEDEKKGR